MAENTKQIAFRLSTRCLYQLDQIQVKKGYRDRTETIKRIVERDFIKLFPNKADISEHNIKDLFLDPEFRQICAGFGYRIITGAKDE